MVTTLYLVRHGETEGSEAKRYKGSIDVPLSEKGAEQVKGSSLFIREYLGKASLSKHMSYLKDIHKSSDDSADEGMCEAQGLGFRASGLRDPRTPGRLYLQPQQGCQVRRCNS